MEDNDKNSRFMIIGAVVLAALVAGGLWYAFVFRGTDDTEFVTDLPAVSEDDATLEADIYATQVPTISAAPTMVAEANFSDGTLVDKTPVPEVAGTMNVGTTAKTGSGEIVLAASLAGVVSGTYGLRRIRKK